MVLREFDVAVRLQIIDGLWYLQVDGTDREMCNYFNNHINLFFLKSEKSASIDGIHGTEEEDHYLYLISDFTNRS